MLSINDAFPFYVHGFWALSAGSCCGHDTRSIIGGWKRELKEIMAGWAKIPAFPASRRTDWNRRTFSRPPARTAILHGLCFMFGPGTSRIHGRAFAERGSVGHDLDIPAVDSPDPGQGG